MEQTIEQSNYKKKLKTKFDLNIYTLNDISL